MTIRFALRAAIAGLVLTNLLANEAGGQQICLSAPRALSVGDRPVCVIAANVNGDDQLDLVVANYISDNVSVLLGNEFGGFEPAVSYPTGNAPLTVAAEDLDGDLDIDLAIGHDSTGVAVLLNNGSGSFGAPYIHAAGVQPAYVAIADLDGDQDRDLAVANVGSNNISILLNNGNGTFGAATNYGGISTWPRGIVAVDLDDDVDVDLAVGSEGFARVDVLKNNGDGTFGGQAWYGASTHPWWVLAEDVDLDDDPDLIAVGGTNWGENLARVMLNAGNGTFSGGASYACGDYQRGACAADLNGDTWPDIVVAVSQSDYVAVLINNGAGGFLAPDSLTVGSSPYSVTSADVDGDLDFDVAVALSDADKVAILVNDGSGALETADSYRPQVGPGARSVGLVDTDGDHDLDLIWADQSFSSAEVLRNSGDGVFDPDFGWAVHPVGSGARYIAISDIGLDADPDVIVANGGESSITVLENDGSYFSNWPRTDYSVGGTPIAIGSGLFNADPYPDLAVANYDAATVSVLIGAADGTFGSAVDYSVGDSPQAVVVADFTGDDITDLAVPCWTDNSVTILSGVGNGTFSLFDALTVGLNPKFAAAGDFDRDLDVDLAVASESGDGILVCLNDGFGGLLDTAYYAADSGLIGLIAEDLTGDGILDLAATSFSASALSILIGAGDGSFGAASTFSVGYDTRTLCAGDVDDDGDLDIATASWANGALHVVRNCGYVYEKSVTTLNDWGPGSLRQAINAANSSPGYTAVYIEAGGTLTPSTPLPPLEDDSTEIYPVDIAKRRLEVPVLVLDGSLLGSGNGLEIASSHNSVSGIGFRNFPENGIAITGSAAAHNAVRSCGFHENGGLAIDLGDDGVTLNDPGDADTGPNTLVNYPTIDTVFYLGADTFYVAGQASPNALVEIHLAEQYLGADTIADPSGHGEGWRILDAANADGTGRFVFERLGARRWCKISAVATDAANNTSEFSPNRELIPDSLIFTTYSPVTLVVIEPDLSDSIGPGFNTIGSTASYDSTTDWGIGPSGQAGEPDDRVVITNVQGGDYIIKVRPNAGASGDGYFFGIRVDGTNEVYASIAGYLSPVPVENPLPAEGTEAAFDFPLVAAPRGDLDNNKVLDAVDLAILIDIVFFGAGQPDPAELGDINCDSVPDAVDLAILIDYVFFGGVEPCR